MDSQTLKIRLASLRQKSKRALGLYKKMGRDSVGEPPQHSELQMAEWRAVASALCDKIGLCLEESSLKRINVASFAARDHFHALWRTSEGELHSKQAKLVKVAESGEFVKASILSLELIALKARCQACQAAYNELQNVLSKNRAQRADETTEEILLPSDEDLPRKVANVIPLRSRG